MKPEMSIGIGGWDKVSSAERGDCTTQKMSAIGLYSLFFNSSFKDDIDHTNRNTRYDTIVCLQGLDKKSEIGFLSPV